MFIQYSKVQMSALIFKVSYKLCSFKFSDMCDVYMRHCPVFFQAVMSCMNNCD
jgi:hypothetical protein